MDMYMYVMYMIKYCVVTIVDACMYMYTNGDLRTCIVGIMHAL